MIGSTGYKGKNFKNDKLDYKFPKVTIFDVYEEIQENFEQRKKHFQDSIKPKEKEHISIGIINRRRI